MAKGGVAISRIHIALLVLLLLGCVGCSQADTENTASTVSPGAALESVASDGFGTHLSSVVSQRITGEAFYIRVDITLDSLPELPEIDTAVAGILAHAASQDASQTPILVHVTGRSSASSTYWRSLDYDWGAVSRLPNDTRGSIIWLSSGTSDPPDTSYDSFHTPLLRGVWRGVDELVLSDWALNGAPTPEPWTE